MILGGLLGLGLSSTRRPLYEATTKILISVDRSRASIRDDITIYQADDRVRALILADTTLRSTLQLLRADYESELPFNSPAELRDAIRITQLPAGIDLYVYSHEPDLAARAADAWAHASLTALKEASLQSILAAELQSALYESHCNLSLQGEGDQQRVVWVCTSDELREDVGELPKRLLEVAMESRGILPFYSFSLGQAASIPNEPILWNRSWFIIAGLSAGMILGSIVCVLVYQPKDENFQGDAQE
jgi:hypothetical protein